MLLKAQTRLNPWDACHALLDQGLGVAGGNVVLAEPDLEQRWQWASPNRQAFGNCRRPRDPMPPNRRRLCHRQHQPVVRRRGPFAARGNARARRGAPSDGSPLTSCIAHLDTGYDPGHAARPRFLNTALARNFVDDDRPQDATDKPTALVNMFGHGTGTLSILAGKDVDGRSLGAAGNLISSRSGSPIG